MRGQEVARQSPPAPDAIRLAEPGGRHASTGKSDLFEDILDVYQRKAAQRMLEDFESNGVDEDLEALRAGWASNFKSRPGMPQPRKPILADLSGQEEVEEDEEDYFLGPRSVLAAQGQRAQQRLQGLQQLRRLASGEKVSYDPGDSGGRLLAAFPAEPLAPMPPPTKATPSRPARQTTLKSKAPAAPPRDPWAEWEARWSEEFRRFEDMERLRQRQSYEAQRAAEREREAEWHRRVQAERERAAEQSAKNSYRRSRQEYHQQRPPDPPKKESKSTGWLPPRAPKAEPASKASAGRSFASFAEFAAAWQAFEQRLASGSQRGLLTAAEIPWPHSLPSVSGVQATDSTPEAKKKLRTALIRWHPDKWAPILEHVVEAQRGDVLARVKEVTQRLLEEKKVFDAK